MDETRDARLHSLYTESAQPSAEALQRAYDELPTKARERLCIIARELVRLEIAENAPEVDAEAVSHAIEHVLRESLAY